MVQRRLPQTFYHLAPVPRLFPNGLEVDTIGYISSKTRHIRRRFSTFNYSYVLSGTGRYFYEGSYHDISAPCVLTQVPNVDMDYGPDAQWEELFVIYPPAMGQLLSRRNYLHPGQPFWHIDEPHRFARDVDDFFRLINSPQGRHGADRVDHICEELLRSSLYLKDQTGSKRSLAYILEIDDYLDSHLHTEINWEQLCSRHGVHPAKFRREWKQFFRQPPGRSLVQKRIQHAKRRLVESSLSASHIAGECGYRDELYFYRIFRKKVGMTALEYRRKFKDALL